MPYAAIAAALLAAALAVDAAAGGRMYQWVDPASGHTHLSGHPPPWYRSGEGPRVLVFEEGRLVDDTARPPERRRRERPEAGPTGPAARADAGADVPAPPGPPAEDDAARVARLKALIAAWEALRTAEAEAALGDSDAAQPAAGERREGNASERAAHAAAPADPPAAAPSDPRAP